MNSEILFKKYIDRNRATYVMEQILKGIQGGSLKVGDKLPSEEEIAKQVGISRASVREALSALQLVGIIERRAGDGTYVRDSTRNRIDRAIGLLRESESPLEIWEARKGTEIWISQLAIEKLSQDSLQAIEESLQRMRKASKVSFNSYLEENKLFHLAVAKAACNSILERILGLLMEITDQYLSKEIHKKYVKEHMNESLQKHEEIFAAIKAKDKNRAAKAIELHFDKLKQYFEEGYGG